MKLRVAATIAALMLVAAVILLLALRPTHSGQGKLHGVLVLYPIGPTCSVVSNCSRAASDQVVELTQNGKIVAKTTTNSRGEYDLWAGAGDYTLQLGTMRYGRPATGWPKTVRITTGQTTVMNATIDTGIR